MPRIMSAFVLLLTLLLTANIVLAANPQDMSVRIFFDSKESFIQLKAIPLDVVNRGENFLEIVTDPTEVAQLEGLGFKTETIHESLGEFFRSRLDATKDMGGYKTLDELYAYLDAMILDHPTLVSAKQHIGYTIEGRDTWAVCISDNPNTIEDEPEALYTACTHAREVITPEVLFHFMDHLTDNYGIDPEVTDLVDSRQLWFIIPVNPDGYYYNQIIEPGGGGMWRKNRRENLDLTYGVDLNRNFGYEWGYDDQGSSPDGSSSTYRGTGPFSEPETQNIRDFIIAHDFVITVFYHSYSNLILWPWGYDYLYTPDNDIFEQIGDSIVQHNGYDPGPGWELYVVNGSSDDWCYGEQTLKDKCFSITPEVGDYTDNFWPSLSRIPALVAENLEPNLFIARAVGNIYALRAPAVPAISSPPEVVIGNYLVEWVHEDTLNPATSFQLLELQGLQTVTETAEDFGRWENNGFTISSGNFHSASTSFYSGSGNSLNHSMKTNLTIDVEDGDTLRFWALYDIESDWDYAYVEVSTDGLIFQSIAGNLTTTSNPNGQNHGHGITGTSGGWVEGIFDLSAFAGSQIFVRFSYLTDGYVVEEGIYIDDISPLTGFDSQSAYDGITVDFYSFSGKLPGEYHYMVAAQDAEGQWSRFSPMVTTAVTGVAMADLDLDGISSTIGDLVLFENYFKDGLGVFNISLEGQVAQTDANCDAAVLTEADLAVLSGVVLEWITVPCYGGTFMPGGDISVTPRSTNNPGLSSAVATADAVLDVAIENLLVIAVDTAWVDVRIDNTTLSTLGYDLSIEYDNTKLTLLQVVPGDAFPNWHSGASYVESVAGTATRVSIAAWAYDFQAPLPELTSDDYFPIADSTSLCRLKFEINDPGTEFATDLVFLWTKCGDNLVATGTTELPSDFDHLVTAQTVLDADQVDITGTEPLYGGGDPTCLALSVGGTAPVTAVQFTNGRLTYQLSCCVGVTGNIDNLLTEVTDVEDLTQLIDHLFINFTPLECVPEADMAMPQDGIADVNDLTALIDHLFINFAPLPACP